MNAIYGSVMSDLGSSASITRSTVRESYVVAMSMASIK